VSGQSETSGRRLALPGMAERVRVVAGKLGKTRGQWVPLPWWLGACSQVLCPSKSKEVWREKCRLADAPEKGG
jgi:hypothetical protein